MLKKLFSPQRRARYIGLDIGGTKILIQSFDAKLNPIRSASVKTDVGHGRAGFLRQLYGLIDEFFLKGIKGIGVALPGIVEAKTGVLVRAPHLPTGKNLRIKSLLEGKYKIKIHVDNDINAFLAEQCQRPRLKKYRNVLAVMIGTGVGGAAMVDGKIMRGKNGFAGEFGHMVISSAGTRKTLEEHIGGHFLAKNKKLTKALVANLGIGLANLNLIFNPQAIVLGGSVYQYHAKNKKDKLKKLIASRSLDGKSPELLDAEDGGSVAKGAVLLLAHTHH